VNNGAALRGWVSMIGMVTRSVASIG
jgi:hypothetical protein